MDGLEMKDSDFLSKSKKQTTYVLTLKLAQNLIDIWQRV